MDAISHWQRRIPPLLVACLGGCSTIGAHDINALPPAAQTVLRQQLLPLRDAVKADQTDKAGSPKVLPVRQPLSVNDAVKIALLHHHGLSASADVSSKTYPVQRTVAETRKAYYQSIAAAQSAHYLEQVNQAARIAWELTARMAERGNVADLDAMREQVFYLDTSARLMRAQIQARQERDHLLRQLGLHQNNDQLLLPQHLPDLPEQAIVPRLQAGDGLPEQQAAYATYRQALTLAQLYQNEVVPLHRRISAENLLRYNGMLVSVFSLLADAREQADAFNAAIKATLDFWIADSNLRLAFDGPVSAGHITLEGNTDD